MQDAGTPTRRRRLVRILFSALAVVALALIISAVGVGAGGLPWTDTPTGPADGFPQRIEKPYVVRELPAQPGALAGLVRSDKSWLAVSPRGRIWELTDDDERFEVQPALSDDGRILAYLRKSSNGFGEYVIRNLATGDLLAFPNVSSDADGSDAEFWVAGQQPTYVSPDGTQVVVRGGRIDGRDSDGLLIGDGAIRELFVKGAAFPAGWSPDGRLAWLSTPTFSEFTRSPQLVATTDTGEELGRLRLKLTHAMQFSQWSARISPDADFMALTSEAADGRAIVVRMSLEDGEEVGRAGEIPGALVTRCQPSWRGDQILVAVADPDAVSKTLVDLDGDPVVLADPRVSGGCSVWASRALEGDTHRGISSKIFGTNEWWWTWRWRELSAALLLVIAGLGLWWARPAHAQP